MARTNVIEPMDGTDEHVALKRRAPVLYAGALLGVGLGGVIDGILFPQLLQWHHMLSSAVPPVDLVSLETNLRADGLGALFALGIALTGLAMLWSAVARPGVVLGARTFLASIGAGWCGFNVGEGLLAHHILGLHHVREGVDAWAYDLAYLLISAALGAVLIAVARGWRPRTTGARGRWLSGGEPTPELSSPGLHGSARPVLVTPPPRL